jgi:hypothetical protein
MVEHWGREDAEDNRQRIPKYSGQDNREKLGLVPDFGERTRPVETRMGSTDQTPGPLDTTARPPPRQPPLAEGRIVGLG